MSFDVQKLIQSGRFPAALILEGTAALDNFQLILKTALCDTFSGCENCPSCKKIERKFHPDWIRLPEDFKLEDIRKALGEIRKRPFESKYRILEIPRLQSHQVQIQNALLKSLEEPLSSWLLILTTESRWNLLSTIRSRCLVWSQSNAPESIEAKDLQLFEAIRDNNELLSFEKMESQLKDRKTLYETISLLLTEASRQAYPGFWKQLAPPLEESLSDLQRNLNPKIVWDRTWSYAQAH